MSKSHTRLSGACGSVYVSDTVISRDVTYNHSPRRLRSPNLLLSLDFNLNFEILHSTSSTSNFQVSRENPNGWRPRDNLKKLLV